MKTTTLIAVTAFAVATICIRAEATPYSNAVLADNPIAYWRFEETSGTTATDSAGGFNGTYNNVTLGQLSAFAGLGNAADFNGSTADVTVPALGSVGDLTIEAWVNADSFTANNWNSVYNTDLFVSTSSHWQFVTDVFGAGTRFEWALGFSDTGNTFLFSPNTWYHIVTTYNQSSGAANLYVNGLFEEQLYVMPGLTSNLTVGRIGSWAGSSRFVDGRIDEVAVYGSTLSASRVLAHYNAAVPEPSTLLLGVLASVGVLMRRRRCSESLVPHCIVRRRREFPSTFFVEQQGSGLERFQADPKWEMSA